MLITKRDGTKRDFDSSKIRSAISKANSRSLEMTEEEIDKIVASVVSKCENITDLNVEQIQDLVEHALLVSKFKATAKQYILYRDQRTRIRQGKSKLFKEIGKKLQGLEVFNSNANVDEESFGGRKGEADSILLKNYALNYCMSEKSR